jgi:hypothetical protein
MDPKTRKLLADCELRERGLAEFFGSLVPHPGAEGGTNAEAARARCSALAFRPAVWDMTALTLQWEGRERDMTVTKVESVDPANHVYRASVRFTGGDFLVDVWLATDGGRLRLKLFDKDGRPTGLSVARTVATSAYEGTWRRSEPRGEHDLAPGLGADADTDERLVVAASPGGAMTITHQVHRHVYFTGGRRLACGGTTLDLGLEQSFKGGLEDGSIVAFRQNDAKAIGADMPRCSRALTYAPDQVTVLKLVGQKLVMYRTDGANFPETAEFHR